MKERVQCVVVWVFFWAVMVFNISTAQAYLFAYYTFDEGTYSGSGSNLVIYDQVGYSQDGYFSRSGAAIVADSRRGGVLQIGGETSGGMEVAFDTSTQSYTFAAWYKGTDSNGYFFDQQTSRFVLELGQARVYNGAWGTDLSSTVGALYQNGQWHHVAYVLDGTTDTVSIYVDGIACDLDPATEGDQIAVSLADASGVPNLSSTGIQRFFTRYSDGIGVMVGQYDNVRVYNNALTQQDIQDIIAAEQPFASDRAQILDGVTTVGHPNTTYTGHLAVYGQDAFAVGLNDKTAVLQYANGGYSPIMAGAYMGDGRLFFFGEKEWGYFNNNTTTGNMAQLYYNVIDWTSQTTSTSISIVTDNTATSGWLSARGYTNVTMRTDWENALTGADLLIIIMEENPSGTRRTALTNFVNNGGGLIAAASGYSWASRGVINKSDPFSAGANTLFNGVGLGWADKKTNHGTSAWTLEPATYAANAWSFPEIYDNQDAYTLDQINEAAASLLCHREAVSWTDAGRYTVYHHLGSRLTSLHPTPEVPMTDFLDCTMLKWEGFLLQDVPVSNLWAHRAALPCDSSAPRLSNKMVTINPTPSTHGSMRYDTGLYAPPGEVVTVTIPSNLVDAGLRVAISHLYIYGMNEKNVIPVIPYQISWFDLDSTVTEIGNVHGGLVLLYLPASPTSVDGSTVEFDGAIEAPVFRLGETTNAQWNSTIKYKGGVQFYTLLSNEMALILEKNSVELNSRGDIESLLQAYRDQIYWMEWLSSYDARSGLAVQMRLHQEYYAAGGVSAFPLSYNINLGSDFVGTDQKYTLTDSIVAWGQPLTLHEHGHHIQGWTRYANPCPSWGEPSANFSTEWVTDKLNMTPPTAFADIALAQNYINTGEWGGGRSKSHMVGSLGRYWSGTGAALRAVTTRFWQLASGPEDVWDTEQERRDLWLKYFADASGYDISPWLEQWNWTFTSAAKSYVSGKTKWNRIALIPRSFVVMRNGSVTFEEPWSSDFSYDGTKTFVSMTSPGNGTIVNNQDGTYTYTPDTNFTGNDSFHYTLKNSFNNSFTNTVTIKVTTAENSPKLAMGQVEINTSTWTTVTLPNVYSSMVVTTSPVENPGMPPFVTRIRNAAGNSFEILAQRADGGSEEFSGITAYYLVAEEGVYTPELHGIRMEAVKHNSTRTDSAYNWGRERLYYQNCLDEHYSNPTVLGQVMTYNDPDWSVFWCASLYRELYAPQGGGAYIGKHVGEDPDTTRADEMLGIIVLDTKTAIVHYGNYRLQLDGFAEADGADYTKLSKNAHVYPVMGDPPTITGGLTGAGSLRSYGASEQGYWPVLVGPEPFGDGDSFAVRIAQDHMVDSAENSSYLGEGPTNSVLYSYMGDAVNSVHGGLIQHHTFDGSLQDSLGSNHGGYVDTLGQSTQPTFGAGWNGSKQALSLDGAEYVDISTAGFPQPAVLSEGTVTCWVKTSASTQTIMGTVNGGTSNAIQICMSNGQTRMFLRDASGSPYLSSVGGAYVNDNQWHMLAYTWVADSYGCTINRYVDGVLQGTGSNTSAWEFTDWQYPMFIGGENNRGNPLNLFTGMLDDVMVFTQMKTDNEIAQMYNEYAVQYHAFEKNLFDLQSGNHGTYVDTTEQYTTPLFTRGWDNVLNALLLNGSEYIDIGLEAHPCPAALTEGTVACWVNTTASDHQLIMGTTNSGTSSAFQIGTSNGQTQMYLRDAGGSVSISASGGAYVNDGQWHFLTYTWVADSYGGVVKRYVDGVLQGTNTNASAWAFTGWQYPMLIGAENKREVPTDLFDGAIDDLTVYPYVLNYTDVSQMYSDLQSLIVGYWPLSEGTGTVAADISGNGNDGVISGAAWTDILGSTALDFGGSSDTVTVGDLQAVANTIALWIYLPADVTASTAGQAVMQYGSDSQEIIVLGSYSSMAANETLTISGIYGTELTRTYIRDTLVGGWHHLAFTYDFELGQYRIYVDGAEKTAFQGGNYHTVPMDMSDVIFGNAAYYNGTEASLNEVIMSAMSYSGQEIENLYEDYRYIQAQIAGHWPLNEGAGTVAADVSGNGHDGTIAGATWTTGVDSAALDFGNSSTDTLAIGDMGITANSLAFWIYVPADITASTSTQAIMQYGPDSQDIIVLGSYSSSATDETLTVSGQEGSTLMRTYIRDTITAGWHHLVFVYNGRYSIYIDGQAKTVYTGGVDTEAMEMSNVIFGDAASFNGVDAVLDDIIMCTDSLSAEEVETLYYNYL